MRNRQQTKKQNEIRDLAIEHRLISVTDWYRDKIWIAVYDNTPVDIERIMVTEHDGSMIIHDTYDSIIIRDGKIMVAQLTENTDDFIYVGRGLIEANW